MDALDRVAAGWAALETGQWDAARAAFEVELADHETPEALDGLGLALWFLGEVADGIATRERAFELYARSGAHDAAARMAVWVSHQHRVGERPSAARGWLARAERVVADAGPGVGQGWVAVERARHADTLEACAAHAARAMEIGRDAGAADLEVFALSVLGRAHVEAGRTDHGMQLLEEAMAAASAGRVRNVHTLAEAYCNLIVACTGAGDWERATEWCEHVDAFARDRATAPLLGACRTVHADVLIARGRWREAEDALASALESSGHLPVLRGPTVGTLAELRVRQGRLGEAERLLAGREERPDALRALALLRLAEGRPQAAAGLLERGIRAASDDAVRVTQLLAPLVDARLAARQLEGAAVAAEQLARLAGTCALDVVRARADLAAARVAHAAGRGSEAAEPARRALAAFGRLAMPLECGEARIELALALIDDAPDLADDEVRVALATFRELGATRATDVAAAMLRAQGHGTAARARTGGELTAREQEVLELLALGMSNARIAATLVISEKTAGHHVSHILAKLGVSSRSEAAAHAVRMGQA